MCIFNVVIKLIKGVYTDRNHLENVLSVNSILMERHNHFLKIHFYNDKRMSPDVANSLISCYLILLVNLINGYRNMIRCRGLKSMSFIFQRMKNKKKLLLIRENFVNIMMAENHMMFRMQTSCVCWMLSMWASACWYFESCKDCRRQYQREVHRKREHILHIHKCIKIQHKL